MERYPDVILKCKGNRDKILEYFVDYGMSQGQQAIESFDVFAYKERYLDLQKALGDDLAQYYMHYIEYG